MTVEPVNWRLAEQVAVRVAGTDPFARSYHYQSLEPDFRELTAEAEALVEAETGLRSLAGPARSQVADRPQWVRANLRSFRRLLKPVTDRFAERLSSGSMVTSFGRTVAGAELGVLLGWMSTRVLGQYDLLVVDDPTGSDGGQDADVVYYVGPNVLALEKRYAFPPREFRLWLALHEVTHRMQFTGVPWMREHYLGLVEATLGHVDPDPRRFVVAVRRAADAVRAGRSPFDDGGLVALLASAQQKQALDQVGGLMSLLEGHGDITMDRAGADRIPSAERFGRVLRQRRSEVGGATRLLQRLIGLEAKLNQYVQGERFVEAVEAVGGQSMLTRVWEQPANLPTLAEIREPGRWVDRVGTAALAG